MESAPLGEFSERLNILDAFSEDTYIKGTEMCMAVYVVCSMCVHTLYVCYVVAGKFKLVLHYRRIQKPFVGVFWCCITKYSKSTRGQDYFKPTDFALLFVCVACTC